MTAPPLPGRVPRSRFNGQVDAHRVFDAVRFPFATFKTIRQAVPGCTVNDAVLTIVGGALRRFLDDHGELPDASLIAMAPISIRTPGQQGTQGNQVAMMLVSLGTDVAKPVDRLAAVYESTSNSKEVTQAIGASTLADYSQFIPSTVAGLAARLYTRTGLANRHNPIFTTTVTNVPGPQVPLYFCGAEMVSYYGLGPLVSGMGLIHPVLSYNGHLSIAFTSCRTMLPDPAAYAACLQQSFDDLVRAARKAVALEPSPRPPAAPSLTPSDLTRIRCRGGRELASDASGARDQVRASRAWRRSATRSAASSRPTQSRTSEGGTSSGEPATDAWVMRPGCSMRDSTAPSDSARVNSLGPRRPARGRPPRRPRSVKQTMPPKSRICFAAASWPGWSGSTGYSTRSTAGWSTSRSTTARAFSQWRSMRTARVLRPRSTR